MSLFKELLKSGESLFRDSVPLDYDFQPKLVPFREQEQQQFAIAIRPLLQGHSGHNLFVYGPPGVGKTTACRHVLRELEEETREVSSFYINCWKENTTFKIFSRICEELGYKFIQQQKTSDLLSLIKSKLNKTAAVFVFDEIDKLEDSNFLYALLEDIYRKSVFAITNYRDTFAQLDERIRSRFSPEFVFFRAYNEQEIAGILRQRREYAFVPGCWEEEAFTEIVERCLETNDLRVGLYLMREAGNLAEERGLRKIALPQVATAIKKVDDFTVRPPEDLSGELQAVLEVVKEHSGKKIGDIYNAYSAADSSISYKSFHRRIEKLEESRFITTEKVSGGGGNTTLVHYASEKKLTEF